MGVYSVTSAGVKAAGLVRQYFPSNLWSTMVAIANAESTFNCNAVNGVMTGLFQIDYTVWNKSSQAELFNCAFNTQMAVHVLQQQGLGAWSSYPNTYKAFLPLANTLLADAAPTVANVTVTPQFATTGTARVTSGGRIDGILNLKAIHGAIPYKVTMAVTPSYGSTYPTSTTTTGTATANTITPVHQSLIAPLPSSPIIRSYTARGPATFDYSITWTVTDTTTGSTKVVNGGKRVYLTIN